MKLTLTLDTENEGDDLVGELLRGQVFNQSGNLYGCYSTFELNPGFVNVDKSDNRIQKLWKYFFVDMQYEEEDYQWEISVTHIVENDKYIAMWYWDGDGTLLIYVKEDNVVFVNGDCKHDYDWLKFNVK